MANTITIYAPISAGLSGQILMSNGEGLDPSWIDNTGGTISAQAAIQLNGGSQQIVGGMVIPEGYGISGQVLRSNGPDVFPSWQQPAEGSQMYLNGSGTMALTAAIYAPLSSGTAGQVLKSNGESSSPSWEDVFDMVYPVGSIYTTISSSLPAVFSLNGRTWEKLSDGQFLMNTTGTTGGTGGTNSMTLLTSNLPAHTHGVGTYNVYGSTYLQAGWYGEAFERITSNGSTSYTWGTDQPNILKLNAYSGHGFSGNSGSTGSGTAFDNRPSYLAVSMWKRII